MMFTAWGPLMLGSKIRFRCKTSDLGCVPEFRLGNSHDSKRGCHAVPLWGFGICLLSKRRDSLSSRLPVVTDEASSKHGMECVQL